MAGPYLRAKTPPRVRKVRGNVGGNNLPETGDCALEDFPMCYESREMPLSGEAEDLA